MPAKKKPLGIDQTPDANKISVKVKNTELLKIVTEEMDDLPEDVVQVRESQADAEYRIITKNPHGWAYITGPDVPDHLRGAYTSFILAEQALQNWFRIKKG